MSRPRLATLLACLLLPAAAAAQPAPGRSVALRVEPPAPAATLPPPDAMDDALVRRRLALAQARLDAGEEASLRWFYGWSAAFGALTLGNLAAGLLDRDTSTREESFLNAGASSLGLITTLALPPAAGFAPWRVRSMPAATPEQRARKLAAARQALERAAFEQRLGRSWVPHVGGLVVNLTSFAIRWFAFDHKKLALAGILPSLAVGESKIWTMPTSALDARASARLVPLAAPGVGGLGLVGSF